MRGHLSSTPSRIRASLALSAILALVAAIVLAVQGIGSSALAAQGSSNLEATIFKYDGADFVRTNTTLRTESGGSAVNTKLDHNSAAYKALTAKRSFSGPSTVFGKNYDANYAPLTDASGKLTGALFIGIPK